MSNDHQNGSNLPWMCQIGSGRAAVAAGGARDMICLEPLVRFFFFFDHTNVYFFNRYLDNSVPRQAANDDNSVPRQWRGTTTTTCHINDKARRWHVEDGAWRRRGTMTGHDAMGHDDGDRAQRRWGVMTSGTMDGARDVLASRVPGMFLFFLFFYTPTTFYWQIDYVYRNWQQLWWPIHVQQGSRHVQTCLEPLPMRFIIVLVSYIAFF